MRLTGLGLSTSPVDVMAQTIQQVEGYYPGSLSYRNNNPGNLIYAGQSGATSGPGGYAVFSTYQAGYSALINQLNLYASRGLTIQQTMAIYCPASISGCDPTGYANTISSALGVTPDTLVSDALSNPTFSPPQASGTLPIDSNACDPGIDPTCEQTDLTSVDWNTVYLVGGLIVLVWLFTK